MVGDEKEYNQLNSKTDGFGNAWGIGEAKKYKDQQNLGILSKYADKEKGQYRIDVSEYIDMPGQYELFVSETEEQMPLRPESAGIWLEGVETPGFCKVNQVYSRMEINITAVPTMKEGSIAVRFKLTDIAKGGENVFLRKVVF